MSSLSDNPTVKAEKNLYKIGFTTNDVEQRIANAENDPTYLMAPVKIVATYKVVNLNSQMFEDLVHQLLKAVQYQVIVYDDKGIAHQPQEWFIVPLPVVDVIIKKIMDGTSQYAGYQPLSERNFSNSKAVLTLVCHNRIPIEVFTNQSFRYPLVLL